MNTEEAKSVLVNEVNDHGPTRAVIYTEKAQEIVSWLNQKQIKPELLEPIVQEVSSGTLSRINNQGREAQTKYLVDALGEEAANRVLWVARDGEPPLDLEADQLIALVAHEEGHKVLEAINGGLETQVAFLVDALNPTQARRTIEYDNAVQEALAVAKVRERHEAAVNFVANNVSINPDYNVGGIPSPIFTIRQPGGGYSCHGFDVVERLTNSYAGWLHRDPPEVQKGTLEAYVAYKELLGHVMDVCRTKKLQCPVELTPQLVGFEGKRVEVVDCYGETRRFQVGKSTGPIPIHLELHNRDSHSGMAVTGTPFKSVRVVQPS
jgi:hypothetical protein